MKGEQGKELKLALGTVQFGLDYGINNTTGKIPESEVFEILELAFQQGIDVLDTAHSYGDSEKVIGAFLRANDATFKIVTKLSGSKPGHMEESFHKSLDRLGQSRVYGCLIHDFRLFCRKPGIWDDLGELRNQGKVEKIGFSLYHPKEVEYLLEMGIRPDILQIPFSIFDQRFAGILPSLKAKGIEIHARSVFLQGLLCKKPEELSGDFVPIKDKLMRLRSLSEEANVPLPAAPVNFALLNDGLDKIIVGVDSTEHLKANIDALSYQEKVRSIYGELADLREDDQKIVLPSNWTQA